MVNLLIFVYLVAPVLVGAAAVLYALTRAPDRIQLATVALFAASVIYFAQAYEFSKRGGSLELLGALLGAYSLSVYVCMAALAIYFKRWAWRAALGVFALHILLGLLASPAALEQGVLGMVALAAYLSLAAVGLWALLHHGSRSAVRAAMPSEA
jgi:hypothetical protein